MPLADIIPWHHDNDDPVPVYLNKECQVRRVHVDTSNFTSNLYPEFDTNRYPPVFDDDNIPLYDFPTKVNLLVVGPMNDYWSQIPMISLSMQSRLPRMMPSVVSFIQVLMLLSPTYSRICIIIAPTLVDSSIQSVSLVLLVLPTSTLTLKASYIYLPQLQVVTLVFLVFIPLTSSQPW